LVTIKSACVALATMSVAVALLFAELGSVVEEFTVAVSLMTVPAAVPELTCTTTVMVALLGASVDAVQAIVPEAPTAGWMQIQPAGAVTDWKFVLAGVLSVTLTVEAELGPPFVTTCV
jgi:hypothetical protein